MKDEMQGRNNAVILALDLRTHHYIVLIRDNVRAC
jgi:hypothetical protein